VTHKCIRPTACLCIAAVLVAAGCRSARPLYTFSEPELDRYLRTARRTEPELTDRVVHFGRQNIGQPYEIFLLGEFPYEFYDPDPIYCLSKSDCLTFCEHTYAAALSRDWWSFLQTLQRIRYRDGVIGMLTRNHYTIADWNRNNAFLFEDLTTRLGDGKVCVPLHQVCRRAGFFKQFGIGQDIPDEPVNDQYIPKARVPEILSELRNGDFVNIIRGTEDSQYCGHTGLIAIGDDGTVDFLHSARPAVREQPLVEYVNGNRGCLGIKILRLRAQAEEIMEWVLASSPEATEVSEETLTAALAATPLMSTGMPPNYAENWTHAMHLQSYRLTYDTPLDPDLQSELEAIDQRIGDELGIPPADRAFGVLDLGDRRVAMLQPDAMFYAASVPKICILLAYFETHPEAAHDLDPQVERELQLMIKRSDNELAAKYSQLVGLDQIQEILQSKCYHFYDQEHGGFWCGKHYGIAEPRMGDPVHDHSHGATVRQCLRYYLMLEQGRLVSAAACAKMKEIFAAPGLEFHNDRFVRGLNGRDVTIIRKSGLWEDWHLDTARVQHAERVYVLAGMVHHPKGEEYLAEIAAAVDEVLCGPPQRVPSPHRLVMHTAADDFANGTFTDAALAEDGHGIVLRCPAGGEGPVYESAIIEPGQKFNEAVVSWNVDTPPDAGFCVEMRVGRRFYDSWSPWLYIDGWGNALPHGERVTKFEEGRIDVDYFRFDERFDRIQYRIRAANGGDQPADIRVRRIAVCVNDLTGIPPAMMAGTSRQVGCGLPHHPGDDLSGDRCVKTHPTSVLPVEAWQRRLPVPFRTQATENPKMAGQNCSPTSVAMMLEYRGVNETNEDVAETCYDPVHDIYGNWPRAIQAAYTYGVPGYLDCFSDWDEIKNMIAAGQPLVMSIRAQGPGELTGAYYDATGGHLLVLVGFKDDDHIAVNDPAYRDPEKGQRTYLREDLENVWMRARGGLAYVLLPRE
jgi:hypothetical protein